jgi:hypothetical protein
MHVDMKPFFEEGVRRYAEAKATITAFESGMCQSLGKAVESRSDWSPLKKQKLGRPKPGGAGGGDGYWIAMSISGISLRNEETEIDCGLWWDAPKMAEPIVYSSFYHKPERVVKFTWKNQKQGIKSFDGFRRTFLYLPVPEPLEVEEPIGRLLDSLLLFLK